MKKSILLLWPFVLITLASCGSGESEPQTVEEKQAKITELRAQVDELEAKIAQYEQQVAAETGEEDTEDRKMVETLRLIPTTFQHFIEVQGDVTSEANVMVSPEIQGVIVSKSIDEGDAISKGQVIATLDTELIRAQIDELQTKLALAEAVYRRQDNLWKQKIGSEVQYLEAKNNVESLQKSIESLEKQMAKANVKSPISGVVDEVFQNVGEMATPAAPLARVINLSRVEVGADVSEAYLNAVKEGQRVEVRFPLLNIQRNVPIQTVGQFIQPQNRTFRIEMRLENREGLLKPNASAVVKINDYQRDSAIVVPSYLVQQSARGDRFLFVTREEGGEHIVRKVSIEIGRTYQGNTEVLSGLKADDLVIIKGYSEVTDGDPVNMVNVEDSQVAMEGDAAQLSMND